MNYIRDKYIPNVIKKVLKDYGEELRDFSNEEFVEFCQALWDQAKKKEIEIGVGTKN